MHIKMDEWYSHTMEYYTRMIVQSAATWMNHKHNVKQKKSDTRQQNKNKNPKCCKVLDCFQFFAVSITLQ